MRHVFRYPHTPLLRAGDLISRKVDWKTNENLAVGKGATVQEFFATA